jgi:hypothetical protein
MPKTVAIAASSSGGNELLPAVAGCIVRVLAYKLSFSGTVNAKFVTDTSGTPADLTGLIYGAAAKDSDSPPLPQPESRGRPTAQFESASGKNVGLNLSGAVAVGGWLMYEVLPANLGQQ